MKKKNATSVKKVKTSSDVIGVLSTIKLLCMKFYADAAGNSR